MLTRSLAVRMDFDMRILPAELLTPVVTAFTARLLRLAKCVLGLAGISHTMLAQARGLFLTNLSIKLHVAHISSLTVSWKHTFHWL